MQSNKQFKDLKALIVNGHPSNRKMHASVFKLLGFQETTLATEASDGFRKFKEDRHDIIFADLENGVSDGLALAEKIRTNFDSPNKEVPIICIASPCAFHLVNKARELGVNELLEAPYSVDDIRNRVIYVFDEKNNSEKTVAASDRDLEKIMKSRSQRPNEEDTKKLTKTLLEYYSQNHEVLMIKVRFARDATNQSFKEDKELKGNHKHQAEYFDRIWTDIIERFASAGISEEGMLKIERIFESVPQRVFTYYNKLVNEDTDLNEKVSKLDVPGYQEAKNTVNKIQSEPNIMTGLSSEDYAPKKDKSKSLEDVLFEVKSI